MARNSTQTFIIYNDSGAWSVGCHLDLLRVKECEFDVKKIEIPDLKFIIPPMLRNSTQTHHIQDGSVIWGVGCQIRLSRGNK